MGATAARLVIHLGPGEHHVVDLSRGCTKLGRSATAGIALTEPMVSERHAELAWDGSRLSMRDMSSTNGTEVNGRRVTSWTTLHDGDRVRWGPVDADVVLAATQAPAPPGPPERSVAVEPPTRDLQMPGGRPPSGRRVFLSHASEDDEIARSVADILRAQGWEPWLDETGIPGGASWAATIQQALRSSSVVVLLVTASSVCKEWVLDEITAARNLRVPVIPALLEDVPLPDDLQFLLQRTQHVDVSALAGFSSDDGSDRADAARRLDDAIIGVMERQGRTNPDRVLMRFGQVFAVVGVLLFLLAILSFIIAGLILDSSWGMEGFPVPMLAPFALALFAMVLGVAGTAMARTGRVRGL